MNKASVVIAAALFLTIFADRVDLRVDCTSHYHFSWNSCFLDFYVMQDPENYTAFYYRRVDARNCSVMADDILVSNCDFRKDGKCLSIFYPSNPVYCSQKYVEPPPKPMVEFYYNSSSEVNCPYESQKNCVKYCSETETKTECIVVDSTNRIVVTNPDTIQESTYEYIDEPFEMNVFAAAFCNGVPIKAPNDHCSGYRN